MRERRIHAYCIQDTWQLHDYMLTIRGYTVFHHGMIAKPQRQRRTSAGVTIILNPALTQAWARAGKLKPIISSPPSKFPGRMIGVTLSFPKFLNRPTDNFEQKSKGSIKLFLCLIYHPYEFNEQREFYDELDHFINTRPRNSEILMGADVNFNVGIIFKRLKDILGQHGLDNRNLKGRELLYLYKSNNFKILLSFFAHTNYITYRSFN